MRKPASKTGRARRRRAKATVDFATGEVHDRLIDAATGPGTPAQDELSNEERAQVGADQPESARRARARAANQAKQRRWVKRRKLP
jgi:hypothetical protein